MLIAPVKAEGLRGVLLVYERDRLAIDNPVVTLDDEILANTVSDELSAVTSELKFSGEGVSVVLASEPVAASGESRLENMRRMRPASRQVPLVAEPGQEQRRRRPRQATAALSVSTQ